jgi:hypothetical protein
MNWHSLLALALAASLSESSTLLEQQPKSRAGSAEVSFNSAAFWFPIKGRRHQGQVCATHYNYRPDSDLYVIYNVGTRFASLAAASSEQLGETRFEVKFTYSFSPARERSRKAQVTDPKEDL